MTFKEDPYRTLEPKSAAVSMVSGLATVPEAAEFLHLSKAMVHKLVAAGTIPANRYGKAVRIPWAWLRAQARSL